MYKDEKAIMVIKLAGLFKVVNAKGVEMNQGETVTVFNDMCCMAPATLIDKDIQCGDDRLFDRKSKLHKWKDNDWCYLDFY